MVEERKLCCWVWCETWGCYRRCLKMMPLKPLLLGAEELKVETCEGAVSLSQCAYVTCVWILYWLPTPRFARERSRKRVWQFGIFLFLFFLWIWISRNIYKILDTGQFLIIGILYNFFWKERIFRLHIRCPLY